MKKMLLGLLRAFRLARVGTSSQENSGSGATHPDRAQGSSTADGTLSQPDAMPVAKEMLPDDINPVLVKLPGAAYRLRYDRVGNIIHTPNTD